MSDIQSHRLLESVALLPMLHVPDNPLKVAVVGPLAEQMAQQVLLWRHVSHLYVMQPINIRDKRISVVKQLPRGGVDVLLLSPEQRPDPWMPALVAGGLISASTLHRDRWHAIGQTLIKETGSATPWRNYLPVTIYGIMATNGKGKVNRAKNPPKSAKHLSLQYLPTLFVFAKDELPMAFTRPSVTVTATQRTAHGKPAKQLIEPSQRLHSTH